MLQIEICKLRLQIIKIIFTTNNNQKEYTNMQPLNLLPMVQCIEKKEIWISKKKDKNKLSQAIEERMLPYRPRRQTKRKFYNFEQQ